MQPIQETTVMKNTVSDFKQEVLLEYCCVRCRSECKKVRTYMPSGSKKGQWIEGELGCGCHALDQMKHNKREAKKVRVQRLFDESSLINPDLQKATFGTFKKFNNEQEKAFKKAVEFARNFDRNNPSNLFFQGRFGTGKSHLSVSVAKTLKDKGHSVIFLSSPKLLSKFRETYNANNEQTEADLLAAIANADLVVLDDIGAEGEIKGWGMQKLFEVIDSRSGKHSVFSTNLISSDFGKTKDLARLFSRMMMNATPVIMNGDDYRMRNFRQEA